MNKKQAIANFMHLLYNYKHGFINKAKFWYAVRFFLESHDHETELRNSDKIGGSLMNKLNTSFSSPDHFKEQEQ